MKKMNMIERIANSFLLYGGSILGAIFRYDWVRKARKNQKRSERKLLRHIHKNRNTEYGKKYDFSSIKTMKDYQEKVPLSDYEDYRPYIEKMAKKKEKNLIIKKNIKAFAMTSGTTNKPKIIPHSKLSAIPFFKAFCIWTNDMVKAFKKRKIKRFNAKGFMITEIGLNIATDRKKEVDDSYSIGHTTAYAVGILKYFLPLVTQLPMQVFQSDEIYDMRYIKARYALQDPSLNYFCGVFMIGLLDIMAYIEDNHEMLIEDIENGTIHSSIKIGEKTRKKLEKKLKKDPLRAQELREIFKTKSKTPLINRLWKNMSYVFAIGTGDFSESTRKMRSYCENDVVFGFVMYASTEAMMGCAMHSEDPTYLLVNDDCFFEFLPVDKKVETPLLMHELEVGSLYELIITNKTGLYRYKLGDVVRIMKYEGDTPYIQFVYRNEFITDISSVHLTGEMVKMSIHDVEKECKISILDYALYPNQTLRKPQLELFLETEEKLEEKDYKKIENSMEKALIKNNYSYKLSREEDYIDKIKIHFLKKKSFTSYREKKVEEGAALNQLKNIRVIRTKEQYEFFKKQIEK